MCACLFYAFIVSGANNSNCKILRSMHYTVKPKHQGCTGDCNYRPIRNSRRHIADAAAVNGKSSATCRARWKNVRQSWTNAEDLFRVSCLYSMQSCCVYI